MATREEKASKRYAPAADREVHSLDEGPAQDGKKPSDAHIEEMESMRRRHRQEMSDMHRRFQKDFADMQDRHAKAMSGEEKSVDASNESPTKE